MTEIALRPADIRLRLLTVRRRRRPDHRSGLVPDDHLDPVLDGGVHRGVRDVGGRDAIMFVLTMRHHRVVRHARVVARITFKP
jgi:hypothetical protein